MDLIWRHNLFFRKGLRFNDPVSFRQCDITVLSVALVWLGSTVKLGLKDVVLTVLQYSSLSSSEHTRQNGDHPSYTHNNYVLMRVLTRTWGRPARRFGRATTSSLPWRRWLSQSTPTTTCASASEPCFQTRALTSWTSTSTQLQTCTYP